MFELRGRTALVTGASRGIGVFMAHGLADRGMNLVLAARSAAELEAVRAAVAAKGVRAIAVPTDLTDRASLEALVAAADRELGGVDVLINNAGIEVTGAFEASAAADIDAVVAVNLTSAMQLTRMVLPGMRARGRGHVVNVASLAGLTGTAYGETYCATKHGLVGFTRALRASLRVEGAAVSASVVCPGFVSEAGIFASQAREMGVQAPAIIGTSTPAQVVAGVMRAIDGQLPDVIVAPGPMRLALVLAILFPRLGEWVSERIGAHAVFTAVTAARARSSGGGG